MSSQDVVRRIEIVGTSRGLEEVEQDLRAVSDAQEDVARSSETVARVTETTSRRQLSAAGAYDRLRGQLDQQYRAQRQLERGQATLDRAFQQGVATQAEYDRAMSQLRERFLSATAANDNAEKQTSSYEAKVAALRAQIDPLGVATQKYNAELATYADMASRGAITSDELAKAQALARQRFDEAAGAAEKTTSITDKLWSSVSRLVLAYASFQGLRSLGSMADQWSELQSRVVNATGSLEAGQAVLGRLGEMARRTYSDLGRTAESWLSSSTTLTALGVSIADQLDLVESFNNALVISATRGQRAESVQRAWSDAMAVGKMNMEQFNAIITGSDRLAQALAASMGVNVIELRKLAADGKITRQAMLGLTTQLEALRDEADRMPATISDGLMLIKNGFLETIGILDQASGASASFAAALVIIADNMARLVTYALSAVAAYGAYYAATVALDIASKGLVASLNLVRAALLRIGIGALVVLAGEAVYQFARLVQSTGGFTAALQELGRRSEFLLDAVVWVFRAAGDALASVWAGAMADVLRATEESFGGILRIFGISAEAMASSITRLEQRADNMGEAAKLSASIASEQFKRAFAGIDAPEATITDDNSLGNFSDFTEKDKAAKKLAEAYKNIVDRAQDFIQTQQLEASLIGMSEQAANALRYEFDLLNEARRAGITLTEADKAGFKALAESMAEAEENTRHLKEAFDFTKSTIKGFFGDLKNGLMEGKSFFEALGQAGLNAIGKIADRLLDLALDQAINALLKNLMGSFGGILGGGGGINYGALSASGKYLFDTGGYTGAGAASQPAGIVHAGEYVMSKPAVDRLGIGYFDALHNAAKGYQVGGYVRAQAPANINMRGYQAGGYVQPRSRGNSANQNVRVEVEVFVNDDGTLGAIARQAGREGGADVAVKAVQQNNRQRQKHYQAGGQFG